MKTVLILTDLSDSSTNAAKSSAIFLEKLHSDILLFNSYYDHPLLPAYGAGPMVIEDFVFRKQESASQLRQLANQLKHIIADHTKNEFQPTIDFQSGEGPLNVNIANILKERDIGLIVMGGSTNSNLEHFFFGCDTMEVINQANCPVLIIPFKASLNELKKITLATAFKLADINAITYLVALSRTFGFKLDIVHVLLSDDDADPDREAAIQNHIAIIKQANVSYHQIRGKDVIRRLKTWCKDNGSDILALVHYQHGFFTEIFEKSTTEEALNGKHTPLMIIPSQMK